MKGSPCSILVFLTILTLVVAQETYHGHGGKKKAAVAEPCTYELDFSTTETSLRSAILNADVEKASSILDSDETFSLGAGLTYPDELQCFLRRSKNRTRDPDIVAIKALALNAERYGNTQKLSMAVALSFERDPCQCPLFTPQELDQMAKSIKALLDDPKERQFILNFTGEEAPSPPPPVDYPSSTNHSHHPDRTGRRLLAIFDVGRHLKATESSPTNSFFCAFCEPGRSCGNRVRWC